MKYLALQVINRLVNSLLMLECMGVLFETLQHNRSSLIDLKCCSTTLQFRKGKIEHLIWSEIFI